MFGQPEPNTVAVDESELNQLFEKRFLACPRQVWLHGPRSKTRAGSFHINLHCHGIHHRWLDETQPNSESVKFLGLIYLILGAAKNPQQFFTTSASYSNKSTAKIVQKRRTLNNGIGEGGMLPSVPVYPYFGSLMRRTIGSPCMHPLRIHNTYVNLELRTWSEKAASPHRGGWGWKQMHRTPNLSVVYRSTASQAEWVCWSLAPPVAWKA